MADKITIKQKKGWVGDIKKVVEKIKQAQEYSGYFFYIEDFDGSFITWQNSGSKESENIIFELESIVRLGEKINKLRKKLKNIKRKIKG